MPKKYRVEMTLLVDATNVVVDTDEHTENHEDDDTKAKGIGLDACSSGQAGTLEWGKTQPPNAKRRAPLSGAPPVRIRCSPSRRP
jgi:hypothetical protein